MGPRQNPLNLLRCLRTLWTCETRMTLRVGFCCTGIPYRFCYMRCTHHWDIHLDVRSWIMQTVKILRYESTTIDVSRCSRWAAHLNSADMQVQCNASSFSVFQKKTFHSPSLCLPGKQSKEQVIATTPSHRYPLLLISTRNTYTSRQSRDIQHDSSTHYGCIKWITDQTATICNSEL
jgi:hypothetical protein